VALTKFKPYLKGDKPHPPHPELPPHILKEIFGMKEKIGRLEGKVEILTAIVTKAK